jgi:hypothetical protein
MLTQYGEAVFSGNAAIFVGAGLSMGAGYPGWNELLEEPRTSLGVLEDFDDLPLLAQYYVQATPGGQPALSNHILAALDAVDPQPSEGFRLLRELDVDDIWTTNYDCLIEKSITDARVIVCEDDLRLRHLPQRRRITKMHGSLSVEKPTSWLADPVITRSDYEQYELNHPRLWAMLKATYLTKSMLFLGFSFTDPNIDILLRLSRTLRRSEGPEHFTVLRRPKDGGQRRLHELRVVDLERSNIAVYEVDEFDQLDEFLRRLVRRTKKRKLFISGSNPDGGSVTDVAKMLGSRAAEYNIGIASLAGPAAMVVSYEFGREHRKTGRYEPRDIELYFRQKSGQAPPLSERVGTAIYTDYDQERLRNYVIDQCRAVIVLGGGDTTSSEVDLAMSMGVPVIPVAHTGGVAKLVWEQRSVTELLSTTDDVAVHEVDWGLLGDSDPQISVSAAIRIVRRVMYLGDSS